MIKSHGVYLIRKKTQNKNRDPDFPGNSLCPFWDGEKVTLRKVVGDLQLGDEKGHELNQVVMVYYNHNITG